MRRNFLRLMIVRDVSEAVLQEGVAHRGNIGPGLPAKPIDSEDRKHLFRPYGLSNPFAKRCPPLSGARSRQRRPLIPFIISKIWTPHLAGSGTLSFFLGWSFTILIRDTLGRNVFFIEEVPILPGTEIFHII